MFILSVPQFKVLCLKLCVQPSPLLIICCIVYFDSIYALFAVLYILTVFMLLIQYVHIEPFTIQRFVFETVCSVVTSVNYFLYTVLCPNSQNLTF